MGESIVMIMADTLSLSSKEGSIGAASGCGTNGQQFLQTCGEGCKTMPQAESSAQLNTEVW